MATKPDTLGDGFSECQKPVKSAGKPRKPHGKTPSNQAEKPDAQCDARTEEQSEQTNSRAAAADVPEGEALKPAGPDEELRAALTEAGIGGAKRESLARLWSGIDQAPATIREVAARLGERGKGTGAIIRELEHQADAKRACADQDQVRKRVDRERRAAEKAENEQIERERLARNQVIDSLSDEELNHYKGRAVEQAPLPFLGSRYREADPRSHVPLMIEICRLAREDRAASVATDGGQQCDDQTR
ncbi:MAG TPA: hypothetical protein VMZ31_04485 [Phycisphaerae bacterium]|nr:hypothetical protein [Phycisphaerae bacterium]